jgi:hypothetical protein
LDQNETLPQENILVDVAFYDDVEKNKLLAYPTASKMLQIVANPVSVPMAEFLTYYLFHRKRIGTSGYRSYQTIGLKLKTALSALDGCITFNGQSISTPSDANEQLTEISEHLGEAIGLSIVSRIHELTEADWTPIKSQHGRNALSTFDFQIASDGSNFVQVENKGSSVIDNNLHSDAIKAHYKNIQNKKNKLKNLPKGIFDPYPASLRYGTITALDPNLNGIARCWLTDPPPEKIRDNPRDFRLINRVSFIREWISFISPRSQLSSALSTRIMDLTRLTNPSELDGLPLYKGNNEPFSFDNTTNQNFSFFTNKSHTISAPASGIVVQISERKLMFLGVDESLLHITTRQNFEEIVSYKFESYTKKELIYCVFSQGRFDRLQLPPSLMRTENEIGYHSFELEGYINHSPAGLVFGLLELPEE